VPGLVMLTLPMSQRSSSCFSVGLLGDLNLPLAEGFFLALLVGWLASFVEVLRADAIEIEDTGMVRALSVHEEEITRRGGFLRIATCFGPFFTIGNASHLFTR